MNELERQASQDPVRMLRAAIGTKSAWKRWFPDWRWGSAARFVDRKCRLFACTCCRRALGTHGMPELLQAVWVSERYADGTASATELKAARDDAYWAQNPAGNWPDGDLPCPWGNSIVSVADHDAVGSAIQIARLAPEYPTFFAGGMKETAAEISAFIGALVCDIFGDASRSDHIHPKWITEETRTMAKNAYDGPALRGPFFPLPAMEYRAPRNRHRVRGKPNTVDGAATRVNDYGLDAASLQKIADALEKAGCTDADLLAHCRHPGPHVRGCWAVDLLLGKA